MEKITHEIHDKAGEIKLSQEDVLNQKITGRKTATSPYNPPSRENRRRKS